MNPNDDTRGVSDVVAFALVFGMVITIVSTTFIIGLDGIEALTDDGQMRSADQQMGAVAAAFDDIHRHGSVARSVEVELDGGTLELSDSSIDIEVVDGGTTLFSDTHDTNALELQRVQGIAAYEAGAVTRESANRNGGLMNRAPAFRCSTSTAIVSTVHLDSTETISIGGQDSVRVIGRVTGQTVHRETGTAMTVTVDITDIANQEAWRSYLEREGSNWAAAGNQYTCTADTVVVRQTVIDVTTRR